MKWSRARKKPVEIEYRDVIPNHFVDGKPAERIQTREGELYGFPDQDFVIKGVEGELYPIKKGIFYKTYEVIDDVY